LNNRAVRIAIVVIFVAIGAVFLIAYQRATGSAPLTMPRYLTILVGTVLIVFGLLALGLRATAGRGWNWRAVLATLIGCSLAWIGVFIPKLKPLYDYAWFVGFGASALAYWLLMTLLPPANIVPATEPA
jgi:NCS1 family nucleobase:cation symporter-1